MKINRRQFINRSLAGMAGLTVNPFAAKSNELVNPFKTVQFGQLNLSSSLIGFGTGMAGWQRQSNQTRLGKEVFHRLIREAYDRGVRLFDMADLYGSHGDLLPA